MFWKGKERRRGREPSEAEVLTHSLCNRIEKDSENLHYATSTALPTQNEKEKILIPRVIINKDDAPT